MRSIAKLQTEPSTRGPEFSRYVSCTDEASSSAHFIIILSVNTLHRSKPTDKLLCQAVRGTDIARFSFGISRRVVQTASVALDDVARSSIVTPYSALDINIYCSVRLWSDVRDLCSAIGQGLPAIVVRREVKVRYQVLSSESCAATRG